MRGTASSATCISCLTGSESLTTASSSDASPCQRRATSCPATRVTRVRGSGEGRLAETTGRESREAPSKVRSATARLASKTFVPLASGSPPFLVRTESVPLV